MMTRQKIEAALTAEEISLVNRGYAIPGIYASTPERRAAWFTLWIAREDRINAMPVVDWSTARPVRG